MVREKDGKPGEVSLLVLGSAVVFQTPSKCPSEEVSLTPITAGRSDLPESKAYGLDWCAGFKLSQHPVLFCVAWVRA